MSEFPGGYDVTEVMYIEEATFGTTPTTGTWKPIALANLFDPKPRNIFKDKVGLGRQWPSDYVRVKKYAECDIEHEFLAKQGSPAFEWSDIWYYIITNATYGATFSLGKRLKSISLGAKLDLTTDRFWLLKGCKFAGYSISGEVDSPLKGKISLLSQVGDCTGTDYVSGSATRQAQPTSDYVKHEDCDILIAAASIAARLNSWELNVKRTLDRKGRSSGDASLYSQLLERGVELSLRVNLDFNSTTELTQFINATAFDAVVKIPVGSNGRQVTLSNGKWMEHSSPHRELDLISVDLTAKFTDLAVATIT